MNRLSWLPASLEELPDPDVAGPGAPAPRLLAGGPPLVALQRESASWDWHREMGEERMIRMGVRQQYEVEELIKEFS
jgi:hypothetical protein